jgi:long-chain acyl-CoA synthetase
MNAETLDAVYREGIRNFPRPDRFLQKTDGAWRAISTAEFDRRVRACAAALAGAGIGPGDRVAILSYNRVEWAVVDWACQLLGAADVPIYTTLPEEPVNYILRDSGARAVFVENAEQAAKVNAGPSVVSFDPAPGVEPFEAFLGRAAGDPPEARVSPEDLATLIYTSGTTGEPKGVMLTHRNLVSNLKAACAPLDLGPGDVALSFLPLSHIFERILDYAYFAHGAQIAYAEHIDRVSDNLLEVRPTVMGAVPRFYEKVYSRIREAVAALPPWRRRLFEWARRVGAEEAALRRRGRPVPLGLRLRFALARRLVLRKFAARVGGRMRYFISGGAPLPPDVAEYLFSLGFTILEGYGLTETSPVLTLNRPGDIKLGTVGKPLDGVEIRIAPDGEILARGPNIMKGYHNKPAETAEVLRDGWFATGDIGEFDEEGFLKITDRKKDLLKTAGGKYVAPQPIENRLKLHRAILNAVVVGDRRRFPAALIVPAPGAAREEIQEAVDEVNRSLAPFEKIKKFALLDRDFTIEAGEVTPTLKVRRRIVEERHRSVIDALYAEEPPAPPRHGLYS